MRASDDIFGSNRRAVTGLVEQVRAEQRPLGFLKKHPRIPAVRQMGCLAIAEAELARRKHFSVSKRASFAANKVVHADPRADLTANHVRLGRHAQPLVQRATLIGLKMAETDVAQI